MGVFVGLDGTPEAVLVALAPWRDSLDRVALEAGPTSEWIGGRLVEAGVPADRKPLVMTQRPAGIGGSTGYQAYLPQTLLRRNRGRYGTAPGLAHSSWRR